MALICYILSNFNISANICSSLFNYITRVLSKLIEICIPTLIFHISLQAILLVRPNVLYLSIFNILFVYQLCVVELYYKDYYGTTDYKTKTTVKCQEQDYHKLCT